MYVRRVADNYRITTIKLYIVNKNSKMKKKKDIPSILYVQQAMWNETQYIADTKKMFDDHELYIHRYKVIDMMRDAWVGGYDYGKGINKSDQETSLMRLIENFYPELY